MKFYSLFCLVVFSVWAVGVVGVDMASKKIPNARLLLGTKLLLLALGLLLLNSYLGAHGRSASFLNWNFYLLWTAHVFWALLAGLVLWYSEIWPAGDAKFFILTAAWLPLINPFLNNFPGSLFLSLLVNIFVAAALVVLGGFISSGLVQASPADYFLELWTGLKLKFAELSGAGKKNGWLVAAYLANLTFLFLLQQMLNLEARHFLSRFLARTELLYFFLFFLWDKVGGTFSSRKWVYITTCGYVLYFFAGYFLFYDRLAALLLSSLVNVARFSLLLFFGRFVFEFLMEKKDTVCLGPGELEPGMILSAKAARTLRQNEAFEGAFDDCFKDGLSGEQVGVLKEWLNKLAVPDPKIEVVKGRPFALWIFAGAVISLLFDKNASHLFK